MTPMDFKTKNTQKYFANMGYLNSGFLPLKISQKNFVNDIIPHVWVSIGRVYGRANIGRGGVGRGCFKLSYLNVYSKVITWYRYIKKRALNSFKTRLDICIKKATFQ